MKKKDKPKSKDQRTEHDETNSSVGVWKLSGGAILVIILALLCVIGSIVSTLENRGDGRKRDRERQVDERAKEIQENERRALEKAIIELEARERAERGAK